MSSQNGVLTYEYGSFDQNPEISMCYYVSWSQRKY